MKTKLVRNQKKDKKTTKTEIAKATRRIISTKIK